MTLLPDYSYAQAAVDLAIGIAIGCALMMLVHKAGRDPFDVSIGVEYDRTFGPGPVTWVPGQDSPWVDHDGKRTPVDEKTMVLVRFRCGLVANSVHSANCWNWRHLGLSCDIVAYQVVA